MVYYVSTKGNDENCGSADFPYRTINKAASVAVSGDTVRVYGGVYREWVDPKNGGLNGEESVIPGPISRLREGVNRMTVWKENR